MLSFNIIFLNLHVVFVIVKTFCNSAADDSFGDLNFNEISNKLNM